MSRTTSRATWSPGGGPAWASPWAMYAALRDHDPVHHGRVGGLVAADAARVRDPKQLVTAVLSAVRRVRETPALSAWFVGGDAAATAELAQSSPVIEALGRSTGADPLAARWVVRVIVSLLMAPGRDAAEERAMVERFVAPVLLSDARS